MTTAANRVAPQFMMHAPTRAELRESGQSMIEFLLLVPVLIALSVIVVRANTAIQGAIVNQQYARLQAHFLTFNSPYYPDLGFQVNNIASRKLNSFTMAIADNTFNVDDENYNPLPLAPHVKISRSPAADAVAKNEATDSEPDLRTDIRLRSSVTICTQNLVFKDGSPIMQISPPNRGTLSSTAMPGGAGVNKLTESSEFEFCRSAGDLES